MRKTKFVLLVSLIVCIILTFAIIIPYTSAELGPYFCTNGEKMCSGKTLLVCIEGTWELDEFCNSECDEGTCFRAVIGFENKMLAVTAVFLGFLAVVSFFVSKNGDRKGWSFRQITRPHRVGFT